MKIAFETLLQSQSYRDWFEHWWAADYSVEGCEEKGLDWTINGKYPTAVEFAGRRWGFGWVPPHDREGQLNAGFFLGSRFNWSGHVAKLLSQGSEVARIDGAWLETLVLNNIRTARKISGADVFILGDLQFDSMVLEFSMRGAFVGGVTSLTYLELSGRSVLTESNLRGDVVIRRVANHSLHLNKTVTGGNVRLNEPTDEVDLSQARIAGDLIWDTALARLDARQATIDGAVRFAAHGDGGRSEWGRFRAARIGGAVEFSHPQARVIDLSRAIIRGPLACRGGRIDALRGAGVQLSNACEMAGVAFDELDLTNAKFDGPVSLDDVNATTLRIGRARFESTLRVRGFFSQLDARTLRCVGKADFERSVVAQEARFSQAVFQAPASFDGTSFRGRTSFLKTTFAAGVDFSAVVGDEDGRDAFGAISFQAARFAAAPGNLWCVTFDGRRFNGLTIFDGCAFQGIPRFYEVEFHEDVSLRYATFRREPGRGWRHSLRSFRRHPTLFTAVRASLNTWNKTQQQYENSYRALKMRMSEVGAARDEHRFLALELRARRWRFDPEVRPLESLISLLYDITSSYGDSIWRPLVAAALLVALSAILVYQATPAEIDLERAFNFALQQVFRPFNVWSDKGDVILAAERSSLDVLFGIEARDITATPWLKLVASVQSLGCLTLLFLAALAIRRRFRLG